MQSLVPRRWLAREAGAWNALILRPTEGSAVEVLLRRFGRERHIGGIFAHGFGPPLPRRCPTTVILRLPAGYLLHRDVELPLAAESEIENILGYQMDRLTPFAASAVFWAARIIRLDRLRRVLLARLAIIPRDALQPLLDRIAACSGPRPTVAEIAADSGPPWRIALDRGTSPRHAWQRRCRCALAAASLCLGIVAVALPFARQTVALRHWNNRIAALQPRAAKAEMLHRQITAGAGAASIIAGERKRLGDPLHAIAVVTDALPDGTYLTTLSLRERHVTLIGVSDDSARLMGALAANPSVADPAFAAPIIRAQNGLPDQFSVTAVIRPEP